MKKKSKATVRTPVEQLQPNETIEHYNAVMIEDIRSIVNTAVEGLNSRMDSLENKIDTLRSEMNARFEIVEAAIKCNAQGIRELREMMHHIIHRVDDHEERITGLGTA